ncbi:hypothetical protein NSU_1232 [Novosphingobium pentaromativorans US6-1]|uniref:Uncharacterized protein n=1 Tax=Novosphingobium pentaromativorans US6-1 TaxID=1088721 RepID=G6EA60_9SPHN|nr:hypothetical protein NSU_1232 [Novosphingobium pentaromativorans US6-1]
MALVAHRRALDFAGRSGIADREAFLRGRAKRGWRSRGGACRDGECSDSQDRPKRAHLNSPQLSVMYFRTEDLMRNLTRRGVTPCAERHGQ